MSRKFEKMTDEKLLVVLGQKTSTSSGFIDGKLSTERKEVLDYYHGRLPKPHHNGNSKYISMDVYDTVEHMKAQLLETFSAGSGIVEFTPVGPEDVEGARIATQYTDYVIFRQNPGYEAFSDIIHDGLTARVGVAKVYWEKDIEEIEETFEDVTQEDLDLLLAEPDVTALVEWEEGEEPGTYTGTISRSLNKSGVKIDVIPPNEFLVDQHASKIKKAFCSHRTIKTISELIKEGYDQKKIDEIRGNGNDGLIDDTDPEVIARFEEVSAGPSDIKDYQEQVNRVLVYESYLQVDRKGDGNARLHKVTHTDSVILDIEEVGRHPFIIYTPLPLPHSFYGSNYAKKVAPIQNARTVLVRSILDHAVQTNNPRTIVVKGAVANPRELLDNRIGGIVNVSRPDGIFPFPQASLNPFIFQTIGLLDEDKEDVTGISRLSQGLNKDAISSQNSQGMVEGLVTLSQQRQKIIARNFAQHFLVELFLEVYRLVIEYEDQEKIFEVAGNFVPVKPTDWDERKDVEVSMRLGYGEQEKEAQKYIGIHQMLSSDPSLSPLYSLPQKRHTMTKALYHLGIRDVDAHLMRLEELKPPEPDPMMIAELEKLKAEAQAIQMGPQLQAQKMEMDAEFKQMKLEFDKMRELISNAHSAVEQDRKSDEVAARVMVAHAEVKQMEAAPEDKKHVIISPT